MSTTLVYSSVYSGVHVLEMNCRSVAVMRRKEDSYLNATQILKVAGVDKGRRTKILEREVQVGEHEKVQGGYGKYQGTWIPFERGIEIARQYGVEELLRPLLDYVPGPEDDIETPKKRRPAVPRPAKPMVSGNDFDDIPHLAPSIKHGMEPPCTAFSGGVGGIGMVPYQLQPAAPVQHRPPANAGERYRAILMSVFLNHENHKLPELLTNTSNPPADMDIDLIIDDQGHTSLHWAAALARINILRLLIDLRSDPRRVNFNGESAIIRAVLVTNNFDNDTFYELLSMLHSAIDITDKKGRSLFHHIALTAGIKGRIQASRYYLDVLLDFMKKGGMDVGAMIDKQDKNGDTALNIAARINNYNLVEHLLIAGANPDIPNRAGLRPIDFGIEDPQLAKLFQLQQTGALPNEPMDSISPIEVTAFGLDRSAAYKRQSFTVRGREMAGEFESVVSNMETEIVTKDSQLQEALLQIRSISEELSSCRRVVQQLSSRLAESEQRCKSLEVQFNVAEDYQPPALTSTEALEVEVAKLKAILVSHSIPVEEYLSNGEYEITAAREQEPKAHRLIAKILNVPVACLSGSGSIIDPLLNAVVSEKDTSGLDTQMEL